MEKDYLFSLTPIEVCRNINSTNPFPEAVIVADYLRSQSRPEDRIAILGSEPEILFYADRISATGHIYMYGLMENHRYAAAMQQQLIGEVETAAPRFMVVVNSETSWKLQENSLNRIQDWGDSYIPTRYDEVGMVEISDNGTTRYLWGEETVGHEPATNSFISIYRRKW
jgi:hypothetical protein